MIKRTLTKIGNLLSTDDSGNFRFGVAKFLKKQQKFQVFSPYGLCTNPPKGGMVFITNLQNLPANLIGLVDDPKNRKKDLSEGEVALVNYLTGSYVYIKDNDDIEIKSASGATVELLADGTLKLTGDTLIEGDVIITGNLTVNNITTATIVDMNAHVHSGVTSGSSSTGGPT